MEDEEGHNSYKKPRKIHINYTNDSQMADFLDYENDFTPTQTQAQTQTQTQDDDFYEPNPDDEDIDEEPNASNTQVHLYPILNLTFIALNYQKLGFLNHGSAKQVEVRLTSMSRIYQLMNGSAY